MWTGQTFREDKPKFFEQFLKKILNYFCSERIIGQNNPLDTNESALRTAAKFCA